MYHSRKRMRLYGWDYSGEATYFLTICTKNRKPILSRIVGCGILAAPVVQLSHYGACVDQTLRYLHEHNPQIEVRHWVIMPNHVHILLSVLQKPTEGAAGMLRPTESVLAKFVSSLKRFSNRSGDADLWQSGYYDHIIRDEADYLHRWQYIDNNPANWLVDDEFTE